MCALTRISTPRLIAELLDRVEDRHDLDSHPVVAGLYDKLMLAIAQAQQTSPKVYGTE
jgi:hypothetical protein